MVEFLSALAGIISLVLTILLEWDRISSRLTWLRERFPLVTRVAASPYLSYPSPFVRRGAGQTILDGLKTLLGMFTSAVLGMFDMSLLSLTLGIKATSGLAVLLLLAALVGGLAFGILYLRKRPWRYLLITVAAGLGLFLLLAVVRSR